MNNSLDSRAIGLTDAYGQRFMRPGTFDYRAQKAPCGFAGDSTSFEIDVAGDEREKMKQHTVMLGYEDGEFRPEVPKLQIRTGDMVTWACRDAKAPPFEIIGEREFFQSARLVNESGYAHSFGTSGEFEWVDAYGSGLRGLVRVHDPKVCTRDDFAQWYERLKVGALVMIESAKAKPAEIDIVTGQTVYFAVTKCEGITITDKRLVQASEAARCAADYDAGNKGQKK